MTDTIQPFADALRQLPAPDALLAASPTPVAARPAVNAHIHLPPNFSAFETVEQAVDLAAAQGVGVLGATNYYDYAVYVDFAREAGAHGIFPLFGLEIITLDDEMVKAGIKVNDPGNPGKFYLCGKGITRFAPLDPVAAELLKTIRDNDGTRMATIAGRLNTLFTDVGIDAGLDADAIKRRVALRHDCPIERVYLQERHLAQAFQEVVFEQTDPEDRPALFERVFGVPSKSPDSATGIQNEIRSHLMKAGKAAFVPDTFVDRDHAFRLIAALGGLPCYPSLADGASPITEFEASPDELAATLKAMGFVAAEFIPNRNEPNTLRKYVRAMRDAGLFVTAGTEHNTLDLLPIAPVCLNDAPIPEDLQAIFWEGACVVAAHQYRQLRGEPGYSTDVLSDTQIVEFAQLGEAVIAQFRAANA